MTMPGEASVRAASSAGGRPAPASAQRASRWPTSTTSAAATVQVLRHVDAPRQRRRAASTAANACTIDPAGQCWRIVMTTPGERPDDRQDTPARRDNRRCASVPATTRAATAATAAAATHDQAQRRRRWTAMSIASGLGAPYGEDVDVHRTSSDLRRQWPAGRRRRRARPSSARGAARHRPPVGRG